MAGTNTDEGISGDGNFGVGNFGVGNVTDVFVIDPVVIDPVVIDPVLIDFVVTFAFVKSDERSIPIGSPTRVAECSVEAAPDSLSNDQEIE